MVFISNLHSIFTGDILEENEKNRGNSEIANPRFRIFGLEFKFLRE